MHKSGVTLEMSGIKCTHSQQPAHPWKLAAVILGMFLDYIDSFELLCKADFESFKEIHSSENSRSKPMDCFLKGGAPVSSQYRP